MNGHATDEHRTAARILVIDDEEMYREIISVTLQFAGYDVVTAGNGVEGLAAAKEHHPDLILSDINMPKMDGLALLAALGQESAVAGTPFVFLTGNAELTDLRRGMKLGADDYLTKPFTAEELVETVRARLAKKSTVRKYVESQFDDIKKNIMQTLPHEFRTPLNSILGFSQVLMEEPGVPEADVKEMATLIHSSGTRLHRLLENMVLFGQIQLWLRDPARVAAMRAEYRTPVGSSLSDVCPGLMTQFGRAGDVRIDAAKGEVFVSPMHLAKIVEETVGNALKFSDAGTRVTVTGRLDGAVYRLSVTDAGRGMTREQLAAVTAFRQFGRDYYEQQGAGLGLTIVRTLAELYDGTVEVTSGDGTGTTVTVSLPAAGTP